MAELKEFKLPDVGEGLTEADIVAWHVKPGDHVEDGQIIVEIETAKAVVELPCPWDGTVARLLAEEGQTVEVGVPIIAVEVGTSDSAERAPVPAPASAESAAPAESTPRKSRNGTRSSSATASRTSSTTRRARKTSPAVAAAATRPETAEVPTAPEAPVEPPEVPAEPGVPVCSRAGQAAGAQAGQGPRHQPGRAGGQRPGRLDHPGRRAAGRGRGYRSPFGRIRERFPDGHPGDGGR